MRAGWAILALALLLIPAASAHPWDDVPMEEVTFHLVTADPGRNQSAAWFGHTGLLVEHNDTVRYYAYRLHIVDSPIRGLLTTFTDVKFALHDRTWEGKLDEYRLQERSVRTAPLLLTTEEKTRLADGLVADLERPEPYVYKVVDDNCSTRIRDLLAHALGGMPPLFAESTGRSVRDWGDVTVEHAPLQGNLMHLFLGPSNDATLTRADAAFLPLELESNLERAGLTGDPVTVLSYAAPENGPGHARIVAVAASAGLLLAAPIALFGALRNRGDAVASRWLGRWLMVVHLMLLPIGTLMVLSWTGTLAQHFQHNANILLFSPLALAWLLIGARLAGREHDAWRHGVLVSRIGLGLAFVALLFSIAGVQEMDNTLAFAMPIHLAIWFAFNGRAILAGSAPRRPTSGAPAARGE